MKLFIQFYFQLTES